tara:strand:+ start:1083 stop:1511 length:429 start_codon:yes stop_codon:yes gene_type:complete
MNTLKPKANFILEREVFTEESIIGSLYMNSHKICDTLELPYKNNKKNESSIPCGLYDLCVRSGADSTKYKYVHLQVLEVPNRSFILFHIGNKAKDSKGCILTGMSRQKDMVLNSKKSHTLLMQIILDNMNHSNMELLIKNRL